MLLLTILSFLTFGTVTGVVCALFCVFAYYHLIKMPFDALDKDGGAPDTIPSDGVNNNNNNTPTPTVADKSPSVQVKQANVGEIEMQEFKQPPAPSPAPSPAPPTSTTASKIGELEMTKVTARPTASLASNPATTDATTDATTAAIESSKQTMNKLLPALGNGKVKAMANFTNNENNGNATDFTKLGMQGGGAALRPKWLRKLKQLANVLPG
jgi:hypothetical protein